MKTKKHTGIIEVLGSVSGTTSRGFYLKWICPNCTYKGNDKVSSTQWGDSHFFSECHMCQERIKVINPIPLENKP